MTVLDNIAAFATRLSPRSVCDNCIAERLSLSVRQHANHKARKLERLRAPQGTMLDVRQ